MAQGVTARVFRCFCDCSELTEKEIQDIVQGRTDLVFNDHKVKQLFRAYMAKFHTSHGGVSYKREATCIKYINCYEMSQELLSMPPEARVEYYKIDELYFNCPYAWEKLIRRAVTDVKTPEHLEEVLNLFMLEMKRNFEDEPHDYYGSFKEELLKKLK